MNQKQFDETSDYENYPNNIESDIAQLKSRNVDILFCPDAEEIYPNNNFINFEIENLAKNLCGKARKGHFQGVLLVISKLFNIITPDFAIFGAKDFQQLQIIRKLTSDLNFDVKIISGQIIREENGLAMSSRNARLSTENRNKAGNLHKILNEMRNEILTEKSINLEKTKEKLLKFFDKVDYLDVCDEENLQILTNFNPNIKSRIFVAVFLNEVRLIDNLEI